jgi:hypothetical protein
MALCFLFLGIPALLTTLDNKEKKKNGEDVDSQTVKMLFCFAELL